LPEGQASSSDTDINKDFLNDEGDNDEPNEDDGNNTPPADDVDGGEDDNDSEDDKGGEDDPATEPEEYEIDFGEDTVLTSEDQDNVASLISDMGLNQDQANKVVDALNKLSVNGSASKASKYEAQIKEDQKALLSDENWKTPEAQKESGRLMRSAIDSFGTPELLGYMKSNRADNVHLMNFIRNIGAAMQDDSFVGKGKGGDPPKETTIEERMYPQFFDKK